MPKKEKKGVNKNTVLAREYTINLHKRIHGLYASPFLDYQLAFARLNYRSIAASAFFHSGGDADL
jgi:hypothetical protein